MTCSLDLSVFDMEHGLPLDLGIPFGVNKSSWADAIKIFNHASGERKLEFHSSEQDVSIDGIRCWWTDDQIAVLKLLDYLEENGCLGMSEPNILYMRRQLTGTGTGRSGAPWHCRKLRFFLSLI